MTTLTFLFFSFFKAIREHLVKAAGDILTQYEKKGYLSDKERKRMIRVLTDFCVQLFGEKPSKAQKIATAKAIISVFPYLRIENSRCGGIVS